MARKSAQEARVERITWYLMVAVFVVIGFDRSASVPTWFVPGLVGSIVLISAAYQYRNINRGFRASFVSIMLGSLLIAFAAYDFYMGSFIDPILVTLIATVAIILYGVVTNEG
jgi:hypothetical protein